jgi:hypothetical protein
MLQRRLVRLEKKLNVPPEERHTSAAQLQKADEITVEGVRIYKRASSMHLDSTGRAINKTPLQSADGSLRWTPMSLKPVKISTVSLKGKDEVLFNIGSVIFIFEPIVKGKGKVGLEGNKWRRNQCRGFGSPALQTTGLQGVSFPYHLANT